MKKSNIPVLICCSIFKKEIHALVAQNKINVETVFLDSMLHMEPVKLEKKLERTIEEYSNWCRIIIFGDCCSHMIQIASQPNVIKIPGINCGEILLGREKYHQFRNEGAFLLMPEWTVRWREVFIDELGFKKKETAHNFMQEMHKKLVYLDTGFIEVPQQELKELMDYVRLPLEILSVSLDKLSETINNTIKKCHE